MTLLNSALFGALLISVAMYRSVNVWLFAFLVLVNAVLFLILDRHRRNNPSLDEAHRNRGGTICSQGLPSRIRFGYGVIARTAPNYGMHPTRATPLHANIRVTLSCVRRLMPHRVRRC